SLEERKLIEHLVGEFLSEQSDEVVAYRGKRWVETLEPLHHQESSTQLRENGVYLLFGDLGRENFIRAKYLAQTMEARLVLSGPLVLPEKEEWESWLASHPDSDEVSRTIRSVQELELRAEVPVIHADLADEAQLRSVMRHVDEQFGGLHGVIYDT